MNKKKKVISPHTPFFAVKNLKQHFPVEEGFLFKKRTGTIYAVDGIDFSIHKGKTLGLVGESGCGKSTTARSIAQLYRPTEGEVLLEGQNLVSLSPKQLISTRREVQMIFQDPLSSLDPRMTAGSIISEPLVIYSKRGLLTLSKSEICDRIEDLMLKVGLSPSCQNRYPHEFSGGQKQRIGIARALALHPKLILADEPVSALDVSIQSQILNLLVELQNTLGLTYLFIAHDLAAVEYVSNMVAVMYLGKIVEIAPAQELRERPLHPYSQALLSAVPIPDPTIEKKRKRIVLSGDVPSPDKKRTGCYFYERCSKRMAVCKNRIPKLASLSESLDRRVACFLHHDLSQEELSQKRESSSA